jgi:hypothetical protein
LQLSGKLGKLKQRFWSFSFFTLACERALNFGVVLQQCIDPTPPLETLLEREKIFLIHSIASRGRRKLRFPLANFISIKKKRSTVRSKVFVVKKFKRF